MISLTYIKLIISGKKYIDKEDWDHALNDAIIPALRDIDIDGDHRVTAAELLRAVVKIVATCLRANCRLTFSPSVETF